MDDPEGRAFWIPEKGSASSMSQLVTMVTVQMKEFDKQGYNYTEKIQMQADHYRTPFRAFLEKLVENQMCKRMPGKCYSSGIGDTLHSLAAKVDKKIDNLDASKRKTARRIVKRLTAMATGGKASPQFSSCSVCGGTKSISKDQDNLGRAGKLNRFTDRRKK